jgi:sugar lactone lactonase YvrE
VNGIRYAARTSYVYYTSTAQKLFMRAPVDAATLDPAGEPELVTGGTMPDDFCIDEATGAAYVTTHRQNTIDRVSLDPEDDQTRHVVVGEPFDEQLIGPTSVAWGRAPGDYGRIAYVTTDGGLMAPPPNGARPSKLVRLELPPAHGARPGGRD